MSAACVHIYIYGHRPYMCMYTYLYTGHICTYTHTYIYILNMWSIYICLCILEVWNTKWVWLSGATSTRIQTIINAILVSVFLNSSRICYRFAIDCFMDALFMDMYSHVHISILTFYSHGPIGSSMGPRGSQKGLNVDPRSKESNMSSKDAQGKPTNHNTIYLHVLRRNTRRLSIHRHRVAD